MEEKQAKLKLSRAVLVEGKYDKIKLTSLLDACILTTEGFGIFKNKEKLAYLRKVAAEKGLIVLTDADSGGLLIRNYVRSTLPPEQVVHLYIPPRTGKEKRKKSPGKEGLLGVEGSDAAALRALFLPFAQASAGEAAPAYAVDASIGAAGAGEGVPAGAVGVGESAPAYAVDASIGAAGMGEGALAAPADAPVGAADLSSAAASPLTRMDFYLDGFCGGSDSASRRKQLARAADLPENLSAKALLEAFNLLGGRAFYESCKRKL